MTANGVGGPQDITPEGADTTINTTSHHQAPGGVSQFSRNGHGSNGLRAALESLGGSLKSWTVMSDQSDPFRMDTPANHRDAEWLARTMLRLSITQSIHDRGIHYAILGQPKPLGEPYMGAPYVNTADNWEWLQYVIKVARWLGYVDYEQIRDQRNDAPEIRMWTPPAPTPYVSVDFEVYLPSADDLRPQAKINGFTGSQPYHLVLIGEKSSLRDVLGPIAASHQADLYLPAGDPSDTMFYKMAKSGVDDDRPMVVLYFADSDPSGWNMPIVASRKLQAFKASLFSELEFQVHRVALTPDHVRQYADLPPTHEGGEPGLPSTPLKESERRADKWRAATGTEQTEIDALATLRPELLRTMARDAITPFFDRSLERRVIAARQEWVGEAQARIDEQDGGDLDQLRDDAAAALADKQDEIQAILDDVRIDPDQLDLPEPVIPEAVVDLGAQPSGLCDSRWDLDVQIRQLIASKNYRNGEMGDRP